MVVKPSPLIAFRKGLTNVCTSTEICLFNMLDTTATNLLDIMVINEPFYWYVPEWSTLLKQYKVTEILIDLNSTNGNKILDEFKKEGWKESHKLKIQINCNTTIKGVMLIVDA